jgi:ABC-type antimicrobial peptide transport system permease subunit
MPSGPVSFEAAIVEAQAPVTAALHAVVQAKLPGVRVTVRTLTSQVERSLITERLLATLAGAFGALALILAVVGVYGLLTYSVTLRTGEIGIRMALGARRAQVLRLVLGEILAFTAVGMVIGLCAAAIGARVLETMLFGLNALDPATFVAVAVIFIAAAIIAAFPPARRATSVEPLSALRYE